MPKSFVFAALLAMVLPLSAQANDVPPNLDAKAIIAQQEQIRSEVEQRKGRYKDMPADSRATLLSEQTQVLDKLAGKASTTELSEADQITVFNALETIEGIVNKAEDERMVCERVRQVGSNRSQTVCMTAADRRARQEAAAKGLGERNVACLKVGADCM